MLCTLCEVQKWSKLIHGDGKHSSGDPWWAGSTKESSLAGSFLFYDLGIGSMDM